MGRNIPLRVWGPSGAAPELGTAYALEHMNKMLTWDLAGRAGLVDFRGYEMEVTEFDFRKQNEVIYEDKGVRIRSFPAIHSIDGSVSFSLEWNDLKFVFSSDTFPNKWFIEHANNADIVIHETFGTIRQNIDLQGWDRANSALVSARVHTPPAAAGGVFSMVEPRMAVAYHFFNDTDTWQDMYDEIRSTYDGPLTLAKDLMVWNVTAERIVERMAVATDEAWGVSGTAVQPPPEKGLPDPMSDFIRDGKWRAGYEASDRMLDAFAREHGLEDQDWRKGYWD